MTFARLVIGSVVAVAMTSALVQADTVQLDYFSAANGTQPDITFSALLDGNTGRLLMYAPDAYFADIAVHATLTVGGTTVLDQTGNVPSGPSIGSDGGFSYASVYAFGVSGDFATSEYGHSPDTNFHAGPLDSGPSLVNLYFNPGVYDAFNVEGSGDVPPSSASGEIRFGDTIAPVTRLTITIVPEPSALMLGAIGCGATLLRRRRHV